MFACASTAGCAKAAARARHGDDPLKAGPPVAVPSTVCFEGDAWPCRTQSVAFSAVIKLENGVSLLLKMGP